MDALLAPQPSIIRKSARPTDDGFRHALLEQMAILSPLLPVPGEAARYNRTPCALIRP